MADTFDPKTRSWIMGQVRSRDTKPELQVRAALRAARVRFSTDGRSLPGNPDIVIRRLKLAVFVNGCFWHWHGCKRSRMPATNRGYWENKIARNVRRDRKNRRLLSAQGWHYCTIWECNLKHGVSRLMGKMASLAESASRQRGTTRK